MSHVKRLAALAGAFVACMPARASAHDIPPSVTVHAFVKPEGQRLHLLVRVPLGAMRDVAFPLRGDGLLDLAHLDASLRDAAMLWIAPNIGLYEGTAPLTQSNIVDARVSLPSDRSFRTYDDALAHVTGAPLPDQVTVYQNQALLDVLFEYPIRSDRSDFSIQPRFARLGIRVVTALRYLPPGGAVRAFEYVGDPGLVRLDPRWHQAARRFAEQGFFHIFGGTDHLLFLLCLVVPVRRFRALVLIVTAFTVAHSITLIASASGLAPDSLWFPPLVETLIAASIVYMALENIVGAANAQRRWVLAFLFGLVHGFGFSFALRETLQFAGSHLLASLLSFNVGVELGQLAVLAILIPAVYAVFRFMLPDRQGTIILSAIIGHTAWHWMADRWERLRQFDWPSMSAFPAVDVVRWLMLLVLAAGALWLIAALGRKRNRNPVVN